MHLKKLAGILATCFAVLIAFPQHTAAQTASVSLVWDASPDTTVTGYALYYGVLGSNSTNRQNVALTLAGSISNLTFGSTYFIFAVAYNASGTESDPSNVLLYTPGAASAPTANGQSVAAAEDTPQGIVLTGSSQGGGSLVFTVVTQPIKGTLSGIAPNLIYTPFANAYGADSFTFKVIDGSLDSAQATISIDIAAFNDTPVAQSQSVTTAEDTQVGIALAGSDVEGSPLTYTIITQPPRGSLSGTAPNLTYTPGANMNGADSFTFLVSDGSQNSATANVSISVAAVNDAPAANPQTVSTDKNVPLNITLGGSDVEGSVLTYTLLGNPANGILIGSGANRTYTPNANYVGNDSFTFRVNDGSLNSAPATVSIAVRSTSTAPVANAQLVTVTEDTARNITLTGSDADGDLLVYTALTQPNKGVLSGAAPNFTYTPNRNATGTDSFTFKVNDGTLDSGEAVVSITLTPVNDAPIADPQGLATTKNTSKALTLTGSDVEGTPLTFTVLTQPAHGSLAGSAPNLIYTPISNYFGTDSFTFKVNDGALDSAPATINLSIGQNNVAPLANAQSLTVTEDTARNITLTGSDADGDLLAYTVLTQPNKGVLSGAAPNFTYTPNRNATGTDSFTFKVNDGTLDSAPTAVSITITAVNDPPTAESQSVVTTSEDVSKVIVLTGSDPEGGTLNFIILSPPTQGSLSGTAPILTYTPSPNINGSDSFTYKVSDGAIESPVSTVLILVTPVNDAPLASTQILTTSKNTSEVLVLTGSDVDSDSLTFSIVSAPAHGSLSGAAPSLIYTPVSNYFGTDSFAFKVNDGLADSASATVNLIITQNNQPPVADNQYQSTGKNKNKAITLTATDEDGDPLTYTIIGNPTHGTLSGSAPDVVYTPAQDYSGPDSFTFKANDGTLDSVLATVTLTVSPNVLPIANFQNVTTAEDSARNITLTGSDSDNDTLRFSLVTQPSMGTLSGTSPNLTYTPYLNANGTDSFTFKVNDGSLDSSVATVSITVTPVNDPPVAIAQGVATDRNVSRSLTLSGTDVDSSTLTFTIVTPPMHGSLSGTAPNLTYTPVANYTGSDSFTFSVNDGSTNSSTASVTIAVNSINVAPVANGQPVAVAEDTAKPVTLTGTDADGDPLNYVLVSQPTKGALTGTAPNLTFTPYANVTGADSFTFKANDGLLDSAVATVSITINAVNDVPVANGQNVSTDRNMAVTILLTGSDVENSILNYNIAALPQHGTLSGGGPSVVYTPARNYAGTDSFSFDVDDGMDISAPATVSVTIRPTNLAPTANSQSLAITEDSTKPLTLVGNDPDGDVLYYTIINFPTNGILSGDAPNLIYLPATNFNGTDSFTFVVDDGSLSSALGAVYFTVTPVNDAPDAQAQAQATTRNVSCAVTLAGSDVDGDDLSFSLVSNPVHGTLSGTPPNLTYSPAPNYVGSDSFTFLVTDGATISETATVTLTVLAGNTAPVASSLAISTTEDTPEPINLFGTDAESNPLTYTIVSQPSKGTLWGVPPVLDYIPADNVSGTDSFTFLVSDETLDSEVATVVINILPVNDRPLANNLARATDKNIPISVTLSGFDPEGDNLNYSVIGTPAHGTLSGTAPNLTYTPAANFVGEDSFNFRAYDGGAFSDSATVSIVVRARNSEPVANHQSVTTAEDMAKPITLTGTDPDGDPLYFNVIDYPIRGTLSGAAPNLVYTPATNFSGTDSLTFLVDDGTLSSAPIKVSITVTPVNDAPRAQPQSLTTFEDSPISLVLAGIDVESSALTYAIVTPPLKGILSGVAPNLIYLPTANVNGTDSFTFRVTDGALQSAAATVQITISKVNDAPLAFSQTVSITNGAVTAVKLTGSDSEGSNLTYTVLDLPKHGSLSGLAPNLAYSPASGYSGPDSFTFRVSDGEANSLPGTVSLTISTTPEIPEVSLVSVMDAAEPAQPGELHFIRSGPTNQPLTVNLILGGDAVPKTHYLAATNITFAAGSGNATLVITPVDDFVFSGLKAVNVSLAPSFKYRPGLISSATVHIQDDELPVLHISYSSFPLRPAEETDAQRTMEAVTLHVSAAGAPGMSFILQGSVDLSDWSVVAAPAIGQAIRYSESGTTSKACYYYRLLWVFGEPTVESIASALANHNVSENIVGYVNVVAEAGWNLMANPLKSVDVNGLATVIPEKTLFVPFNSTAVNVHTKGDWTQGAPLNGPIDPGWLYNPGSAPITLTFVGEMPGPLDDTSLPAGWSVRSSPVTEVAMNTEFMDYPFTLGDAVFDHSNRSGKDVWSPHLVTSNNGWDKRPSVKPGHAVLIYKTAATPSLGKNGPKLPKLPKVSLKKLAKAYLK